MDCKAQCRIRGERKVRSWESDGNGGFGVFRIAPQFKQDHDSKDYGARNIDRPLYTTRDSRGWRKAS